jgi:chromosome partitioning protein
MFVLAVASQKGGSGKTTLAGHLAVEAESAGAGPVALIDIDPQASLTDWWKARTATQPAFAQVDLSQLREALEDMEQAGMQLVVIDTPPAITQAISRVIGCADLVLIPTRPSPHDLRAVGGTVKIAREHGKAILFAVNAATSRARITSDAATALSEFGPVAPILLHNRVDFAASMADGRTAGEMAPGSAGATEIHHLWRHVQEHLASVAREAAHANVANANPASETGGDSDHVGVPLNGHAAAAHNGTNGLASEERRSGAERRRLVLPVKSFGTGDRRVLPFGRRHLDRAHIGAK